MTIDDISQKNLKLTKSSIDCMIYQGREIVPGKFARDVRWDSALPGFGVRVFPSGIKSFVVLYKLHGRKKMRTLGKYGVLTLEQAKKDAKVKLSAALQGQNPFAEIDKLATGKTMEEVCRDYLEVYAKRLKKTWQEDKRRIERNVLPQWGKRLINSIGHQEVARFHHELSKSAPYEANRVLETLSVIFRLAIQWGFCQGENPAKGVRPNKEQKRDRWVNADELQRLAAALQSEPNIYVAKAVWMYLFTGARKTEILKAKWQDVDWERRELKILQTKNGTTHYVPLSEPALELLRNLPRLSDNPYIFPGTVQGKPLLHIRKPWARITKLAGVPDVRLHDLRRTVGSWLAQAGNSLHLIGKVLNHKSQQTTAIYARFNEDIVRAALEDHGKRIVAAVGSSSKAEIISFPKFNMEKKKAS